MSCAPDNLDEALRAVAAGDLDALTPEQVARLERVLNAEPAVAARVAEQVPACGGRLAAALMELNRAVRPTKVAWRGVWERIDAAAPVALRHAQRGGAARILRLWKPLAAVAACVLLVVAWKVSFSPAPKPWPMELAANVEIDQLEVPEGATPFVVSTGGENGIQVIWVLQERS